MNVRLIKSAPLAQEDISDRPFRQWVIQNNLVWASFYRIENDYLIRFHGLCDYLVANNGESISAHPVHGVSDSTIQHLYLNQVLPLALSRQYKLILHGAAVIVSKTAVAFIGDSGRGKSTLAASFAMHGLRFLTDDGLQINIIGDKVFALPSHPSIRLWDDSEAAITSGEVQRTPAVDYSPKARLLAGDNLPHCNKPSSLKYIYFLGDGNTKSITISPVSGRDAMIEMVRNSFLLEVEEREMLKRHFGQLSELAKRPIFFRLDYPRRFEMLPEVREAIIRHVSDGILPGSDKGSGMESQIAI